MKKIFLGLCVLVLLGACKESGAVDAPETDKPYKATTVDECIQEKECLWLHFLMALQIDATKNALTDKVLLRKWEKPVRITINQTPDNMPLKEVEKYINEIAPYFHPGVTADTERHNYLIFFSDDVQRELDGPFKEMFDKSVGKGVVPEDYKDNFSDDRCFYFHLLDPQKKLDIFSYFSFIQTDNLNIRKCIKEIIYVGFGLHSIERSPLVKDSKDNSLYTKLELVLVHLLYQDFFKSGMTFKGVKKAYDKNYDWFMEDLKLQGVINDNR